MTVLFLTPSAIPLLFIMAILQLWCSYGPWLRRLVQTRETAKPINLKAGKQTSKPASRRDENITAPVVPSEIGLRKEQL